jgi:hypothetical protein
MTGSPHVLDLFPERSTAFRLCPGGKARAGGHNGGFEQKTTHTTTTDATSCYRFDGVDVSQPTTITINLNVNRLDADDKSQSGSLFAGLTNIPFSEYVELGGKVLDFDFLLLDRERLHGFCRAETVTGNHLGQVLGDLGALLQDELHRLFGDLADQRVDCGFYHATFLLTPRVSLPTLAPKSHTVALTLSVSTAGTRTRPAPSLIPRAGLGLAGHARCLVKP